MMKIKNPNMAINWVKRKAFFLPNLSEKTEIKTIKNAGIVETKKIALFPIMESPQDKLK